MPGKCSHGGASDLTSKTVPRGGISKCERRFDNVALHNTAVNIATSASVQLLGNLRLAVGDKEFLRYIDEISKSIYLLYINVRKRFEISVIHFLSPRMMGIVRSAVVCFVIDTTGSMSDDITEARAVVNEMIDSKKGTQDEPSEYILVPFNDPGIIWDSPLTMFSLQLVVLDPYSIACFIWYDCLVLIVVIFW